KRLIVGFAAFTAGALGCAGGAMGTSLDGSGVGPSPDAAPGTEAGGSLDSGTPILKDAVAPMEAHAEAGPEASPGTDTGSPDTSSDTSVLDAAPEAAMIECGVADSATCGSSGFTGTLATWNLVGEP